MSGKRIRAGVVGLGIAATNAHLPALMRSPDFELAALCEKNQGRLEAAASRWRAPYFSHELASFLKAPDLDAVIVATPPDSHAAIALSCIAAGKHVLLEKPLASNLAECLEIKAAAGANGTHVAVNHEKRFHHTLQEVGRLLRAGTIGQPYYGGVHWASNVKLAPEAFIPEGFGEGYRWRWSDRRTGGGIVQDHLPHYVDLVSHWTGDTPVAVYAHTLNLGRNLLGWPAADSVWEDMGLVAARFSNGFLLRLETGVVGRSLSPLWSLGSGIGEWTEYGYILGTAGQLLFDLLPWDSSENGRLAVWQLERAKRERTGWAFVEQPEPIRSQGSPAGAAQAMFGAQLHHFARLIRGETTNIATLDDGLMTVAAVEAAYRSALTRAECTIAEIFPPVSGSDKQAPGKREGTVHA